MSSTNRRDEVLNNLVAGIARLTNSDSWRDWLKVQSRFHNYSFGNTLLIQLQCPDATRVAGFHAWRKLGRNVRKGEKAIWILAPVTRKASDDDSVESPASDKRRFVVAFKAAAVFDIAQTEGEDLPDVCKRLDGDDVADAFGHLVEIAQSIGYHLEDAEFADERNGDCTYDLRRIRVAADRTPVQRVKTLVHELAHAMLHEDANDRRLAELEAESVAYVVCDALGIDSSEYTFGYVSAWAGGGDDAIAVIKSSGSRIQRTADDILNRVDTAIAASTAAA